MTVLVCVVHNITVCYNIYAFFHIHIIFDAMKDGDETNFGIVVAVCICSCYIVAPVHVNKRLSKI